MLDQAHKRLDAAGFDAYGWPHDATSDTPADLSNERYWRVCWHSIWSGR